MRGDKPTLAEEFLNNYEKALHHLGHALDELDCIRCRRDSGNAGSVTYVRLKLRQVELLVKEMGRAAWATVPSAEKARIREKIGRA